MLHQTITNSNFKNRNYESIRKIYRLRILQIIREPKKRNLQTFLKTEIMSNQEKEFRNDAKNFCVFIGMIALSAFIVINFILVR